MKLNKVLALALSGVMAVSMLAGCKGGSANGEQDDVVVTPTASNAVTIMNNLQSRVDFDADTTLDGVLAAAVDGVLSKDIKDAPAGKVEIIGSSKEVYKSFKNKLPGAYNLNNSKIDEFNTRPDDKKDTTVTVLYWIKADKLTEENVLTLVAQDMNTSNYKEWSAETDNKYYVIDYTGAVSVVKASATAEDGTAYNTYVVAVSVTQSYGAEVKV